MFTINLEKITYKIKKSYKINETCRRLAPYTNNIDPRKNIVIFSDPRGGSTWLAEILNSCLMRPVLWEPLYPWDRGNTLFTGLGFSWRQEIPEHEEWPESERIFERLFRGKILTDWNTRFSSPSSFFLADRMIIKFCRANGMAEWLLRKFSFETRPIVLLRHPFGVAASQLKKGPWDKHPSHFIIPDSPYNDRYLENIDFLNNIETKAEKHVAQWCITNEPLLRESAKNKFLFVYYEDLIEFFDLELQRIADEVGITIDGDMVEILRKHSRTTNPNDPTLSPQRQIAKWKEAFEPDTIRRLVAVLEHFGVEAYGDEVRPSNSRYRNM